MRLNLEHWQINLLKEYILKGYNINEKRFINARKTHIEYFDELLFQLKNIFHEQYARDTSVKAKESKEISRKRVGFIGVLAPYGYLKDPKDKHNFIVDDYASKIVKNI